MRRRLTTGLSGRWSLFRILLAAVEAAAAIGVAAFVLSVPMTADLRPMGVMLLGLIIAFAIVQPGTAGAMVLLLALGGSYVIVTTLGDRFGGALPPLPEVLLISVALYVIHTTDAFRAALPTDAAVDPSVTVRWLIRLVEVLVPAVLLGVVVLAEPTRGASGLWYLGAVALLAAVGIPAFRMRRKPWLDSSGAVDGPAEQRGADGR